VTGPEAEGEREGGPVAFPLSFLETSLIYSILYERSKCLPTREELLDEIARKELYPTSRHVIPIAMGSIDQVQDEMREYLVGYAGEKSVRELETRVEKTIEKLRK